jgi:hypothetical protein
MNQGGGDMRTLELLAALVGIPALSIVAIDAQATTTTADAVKSEKPTFKPPAGFKVKIHDWGIVYCKKMPMLGSRFPKQVCMSEAQLRDYMATNEAMRRDKDQTSRICAGTCTAPERRGERMRGFAIGRSSARDSGATHCTTTAVPFAETMSIPFSLPSTS